MGDQLSHWGGSRSSVGARIFHLSAFSAKKPNVTSDECVEMCYDEAVEKNEKGVWFCFYIFARLGLKTLGKGRRFIFFVILCR